MPSFRLGLFGGTFDPPHFGHLIAAQEAVELLSLDRLLLVVAAIPPHKAGVPTAPAATRLEMVRAAVARNPRLGVSDVELAREGPSYTVDTLRHFRAERRDEELVFLMGVDQLAEFHEWQEPAMVARLADLVVMDRSGIDPNALSSPDPVLGPDVTFQRLAVTRIDISSTEIRNRVRAGRSIQYLVPREVREIIERDRLYEEAT